MPGVIYRPPRIKKGTIKLGKRRRKKPKDRKFDGPIPIEKAFPLPKNPWERPGNDCSWGDKDDEEETG